MSMGVDSVEGVGINGGAPFAGLRPGRKYDIGILINKRAYRGDTHTGSLGY